MEMYYALNIWLRSDAHFRVLRNKTRNTTPLHNPYYDTHKAYITTMFMLHSLRVSFETRSEGKRTVCLDPLFFSLKSFSVESICFIYYYFHSGTVMHGMTYNLVTRYFCRFVTWEVRCNVLKVFFLSNILEKNTPLRNFFHDQMLFTFLFLLEGFMAFLIYSLNKKKP